MDKFYIVKNRSASRVVYSVVDNRGMTISRQFMPGQEMKISFEELEKLTYQPGGKELIANFLQVKSLQATQELGVPTEPEYNMSEQDIVNLLTNGSLDAFLDCLDFAPVGVIDLVKKFAIDLPLNDIQKRRALKDKTGFDVSEALRHIEEETAEDKNAEAPQTKQRRVQTEEIPAGRRTAPKYKIVSTEE